MQLSEEEINLCIAKFMGLDVRWFESEHMGEPSAGWLVYEKFAGIDMPIKQLPDYCKDLNLVYEVEEKIFAYLDSTGHLKREYFQALTKFMRKGFFFYECIHASPIDRLMAVLLTLEGVKE